MTPTTYIDFTRAELRPAPRASQPNKQETFYPVTCPRCFSVRWLTRSDALRTKECRSCHNTAAGKLGYAATAAKHGPNFALRHVRDYRLSHPTRPERIVAEQLGQLGLQDDFEREFPLDNGERCYLVDFMVCTNGGVFAIEVNGEYWHAQRAEADAAKAAALAYNSIPLLTLTDADVLQGRSLEMLATFLGTAVKLLMSELREGDVYLDPLGYEVAVICRDGDQAMIQEDGSLWVLQIEALADYEVTVVRRDSFQLVAWAREWIAGKGWREFIGE